MLTLLYATLLVAILIAPVPLLFLMEKRYRKKVHNSLLDFFRRKGQQEGLSFSSEEVLHNTIIGVDGIQRKLLFVKQLEASMFTSTLLNLTEVARCTIEKPQTSATPGMPASSGSERLLLKVELHNKAIAEIDFYDPAVNPPQHYPVLEQKARQWQTMLQKLLPTGAKTNL